MLASHVHWLQFGGSLGMGAFGFEFGAFGDEEEAEVEEGLCI